MTKPDELITWYRRQPIAKAHYEIDKITWSFSVANELMAWYKYQISSKDIWPKWAEFQTNKGLNLNQKQIEELLKKSNRKHTEMYIPQ